MIQFDTTPIGIRSETHVLSKAVPNNDKPYYSVDIIFSDLIKPNLYCDTNTCDSLPNGMVDLYAAALHEFGHAHGLNHVNDSIKGIMFLGVLQFSG